jgi:putative ABC transport system substrate-binding protein
MRRREFITLLGGAAAAWPLAARAQQAVMPVIGYLGATASDAVLDRMTAFHRGLKEEGYVEGDNVTILYRWAEGHLDRLPKLAADLAQRRVAVVSGFGTVPALAVKGATKTVPFVFGVSEDPVKLGLVASLARPGGNLTGINFFAGELVAKRLGLLRELVPKMVRVGVLVNPSNAATTETTIREAEAAARTMGLQGAVMRASTSADINTAFATFGRERPDALFVANDGFFSSRRVQLANLSSRFAFPAAFHSREITEAGGLMSYGSNIADAYRQMGVYAGRILKGASPADLPVMQSTKFELVINAETARMLGLTVPASLLAVADAVIE